MATDNALPTTNPVGPANRTRRVPKVNRDDVDQHCLRAWPCYALLAFCAILLLCILLPLSFSYVNYNEYALKKGRTTSKVSTDRVYGVGRHHLGPTNTFQKYAADAHVLRWDALNAVSNDKLQTDLEITLMYFLKRDELPQLQREFNLRYHAVIESRALSVIKNTAVNYTTLQYFQNHTMIQKGLHDAVRRELEGNLHVTVPYFYMARVKISQTVADKQLQTAIQNEINGKQVYENQAAVVRKDTEQQVNLLHNNATVTVQQATSRAAALVAEATANATLLVGNARSEALADVYGRLNATKEADKQRIDYMFSLLNAKFLNLHIGYNTLLKTSA